MKHETTYCLTRGDDEIELTVEYSLAPYDPGVSWGPPEDCYPPEGGDVEDMAITLDGDPFEVTAQEADAIEAHILQHHEDDGDDCDDRYYEAAE